MNKIFDPKLLTDQEILDKQIELRKRIYSASMLFSGYEIINQLQMFLQALEDEQEERSIKDMLKNRDDSFPTIIESDREWLSEEEKVRAYRPLQNINDMPATLKKDIKIEKQSPRQEQFKKWQDEQRADKPTETEPEQPKKRGRPRKQKD